MSSGSVLTRARIFSENILLLIGKRRPGEIVVCTGFVDLGTVVTCKLNHRRASTVVHHILVPARERLQITHYIFYLEIQVQVEGR